MLRISTTKENVPVVEEIASERLSVRSITPFSKEQRARLSSKRSRKRSSSNDSGAVIPWGKRDSDTTDAVSVDLALLLNTSDFAKRKSTGSTFKDSLKDEFDAETRTYVSSTRIDSLKRMSMKDIKEKDSYLEQMVLANGQSPLL